MMVILDADMFAFFIYFVLTFSSLSRKKTQLQGCK